MASNISLYSLVLPPLENNCYLLVSGSEALLVDTPSSPEKILALAARRQAQITTVVTTHRHSDHVGALKEILRKTHAIHIASRQDAPALPAPADIEVDQGDKIHFAGHTIPVFILRGHTPGGLCMATRISTHYRVPHGLLPESTCNSGIHLFVGDSLFPGGVGKTECATDFRQLISDVKERVFAVYPDDSIIHPGHGSSTTVGTERPHLQEWCNRGW